VDGLTGAQLIGMIAGGLIGYVIAAGIAGGNYRHIGGGWFELVEDPMGCLPGCLLELALVAAGVAAGFVIGGLLGG
jgi:hypothetical protein